MFFYELKNDLKIKLTVWKEINCCYPEHFHRNIEIIYVLEGNVSVNLNQKVCEASKDDILFIPTFLNHEFQTINHSYTICVIIPFFHSADFKRMFESKSLPHVLQDKKFNKNNIKPLLESIVMNNNENDIDLITCQFDNIYIEKGYVQILIGTLLSNYPLIQPDYNKTLSNLVHNILNFIHDRYSENLTLDLISKEFKYNKYYISKIFNQCVNMNFNAYLNQVRLQNYYILKSQNPDLNITQSAYMCGFNNISTFYKTLKENEGFDIITSNFM